MLKKCSACGAEKPLDDFHRDKGKKDGRHVYCKVCTLAKQKLILLRPPKEVPPEGMRRCTMCKTLQSIAEFTKRTGTYDGLDIRCKKCCYETHKKQRLKNPERFARYARDWRAKNPERFKDHCRKKSYGVPMGWYDAKLAEQGGKCAICGTSDPGGRGSLHIDHCHTTDKLRGLLCHHCNLMLGNAQDKVETLNAAVAYLTHHQ